MTGGAFFLEQFQVRAKLLNFFPMDDVSAHNRAQDFGHQDFRWLAPQEVARKNDHIGP